MVRLAGGACLLLLLLQLLHALLVRSSLLTRVLASQLDRALIGTLMAETQMGDQTLNLGSLVALVAVVLELAAHHELADVVLLAQTEQLADVARTLRTQTAGLRRGLVGQTRNLVLALLHDHQVQHADVGTHDAATHGLALTLTLEVNRIEKNKRHDEHGSKTFRRPGEDAHGSCRELPASWGNPACRFLQ